MPAASDKPMAGIPLSICEFGQDDFHRAISERTVSDERWMAYTGAERQS